MIKKERFAVHISKKARDTTFVDSEIIGGAKIEGRGTKMIRTTIQEFSKKHPVASKVTILAFIAVIADLISIYFFGLHLWQFFLSQQ